MKWIAAVLVGLVLWLLLVIGTLSSVPPQAAPFRGTGATANPSETESKTTRKVSEPYTGDLAIFEDPNRAENLQIDRVMDILSIADGKSVADIGAGSGWFTVRAARRVGIRGIVHSVEINQAYLDHIGRRAMAEGLGNINTVLGTPNDPMLPRDSVDAVLILKTYHEIAEPVALMKRLKTAVRVGGLVGIIDRNGSGEDHGIPSQTVVDEMRDAGFERVGEFDFVKPDGMDYFLVFRPAGN